MRIWGGKAEELAITAINKNVSQTKALSSVFD
jgi:hypothetical protein